MTNFNFPKLIKFNDGQECSKLFIMLLNVEVRPPHGSPNVNYGLIWQSTSSSQVLQNIFFPKRSPRKLQLCRKEGKDAGSSRNPASSRVGAFLFKFQQPNLWALCSTRLCVLSHTRCKLWAGSTPCEVGKRRQKGLSCWLLSDFQGSTNQSIFDCRSLPHNPECYTITRLPFVSRWQCLILASHHSDSLHQ